MNYSKAYEIENGLDITNGPFITGGAAAPTFTADKATLYIQDSGAIWTNPGGTVWTSVSSSGSVKFPYYFIESGVFVEIESGQKMATEYLELSGCLCISGSMELL
jgi:hypothetical protein